MLDFEFMTYSANRKLTLFWVFVLSIFALGWWPKIFSYVIYGTIKVHHLLGFVGFFVLIFLYKNK